VGELINWLDKLMFL